MFDIPDRGAYFKLPLTHLHSLLYTPGTEYYPAIVDEEIFQKAQIERENRAIKLGRVHEVEQDLQILSPTKFHLKSQEIMFEDPFKQAEYAYSMIESEWF